ncbi:MAG: ATP-dependent DNA helicase RecG [Fibromonadaceae bacterium]|nr:ATP-dependent DNA helicase RecG [Fibromonadaceae bacterium]
MNLSSIPGFGPAKIAALKANEIITLWDLLFYLPRKYEDLRKATKIRDIKDDNIVALVVRVAEVGMSKNGVALVVKIRDESSSIEMAFFQAKHYWHKKLKVGTRWIVIGKRKIDERYGLQITRIDMRPIKENVEYVGNIEPVYILTEAMRKSGVTNKLLMKIYIWLFEKNLSLMLPPNENICPQDLLSYLKLNPMLHNLKKLHLPQTMEEIYAAKQELKILNILPFCLRKVRRRRLLINSGIPRKLDLQRMDNAREKLPFVLTSGQNQVLEQLKNGLESNWQYHALLQGDVGSGKTVVAMLAMIGICGAGGQAACMVPTDILAKQHFSSMEKIFESLGLRLALLTGSIPATERKEVLAGLINGEINAVVGTHALFSKDVEFGNLSFVIIDEQHRFGVNQREALLAKGNKSELLVMSATPIPRSLAMTFYGDLEMLLLREKPPGRLPVKTELKGRMSREGMKDYLYQKSLVDNRCYWVVSRVQEDELGEAACVDDIYKELKSFKEDWKIAVVHGQMPEAERDANLNAFASGEISLLVCTTVVEVGVNVPQANLIVIDKPENFGLAQLHQLRGRVGRGTERAFCILLCEKDNDAYDRLEKFSQTNDGFEIAELDLENRAAGNLEGSQQSKAWIFDWVRDLPLIERIIGISNDILDNKANFSNEVQQKIQNWYNDKVFEKIEDGVH